MNNDVRRGRAIVVAYGFLLVATVAVLLAMSLVYQRPWHNLLKRAMLPALLVPALWMGSRWAQWLHAAMLAGVSVSLMRYGLRFPGSQVYSACWPLAMLFASLGGTLGFSHSVRAFLAHRRGIVIPQTVAATLPPWWMLLAGFDADPIERRAPSEEQEAEADVCWCGERVPSFVVLCPYCVARRTGS